MSGLASSFKIRITWEMIHTDIFNGFCDPIPDVDLFMQQMLPEQVFEALFFRDGIYDSRLLRAVYCGADTAKPAFEQMRELLVSDRTQAGKLHTYDKCAVIQDFQKKWETHIPAAARSAGCPDMLQEKERLQLRGVINDFLDEIPPEMREIHMSLQLLVGQHRYSLVLALLSVMATTLSCFGMEDIPYSREDLELRAIVLPHVNGIKDSGSFDLLCGSNSRITWETLHREVLLKLRPDSELGAIGVFMRRLIPPGLLQAMCAGKNGQLSKKYIGYAYNATNGAKKRFELARDYIVKMRTDAGEEHTYATSPVIRQFQDEWETILPEAGCTATECAHSDDPAVKRMHAVIRNLLDSPYLLDLLPEESLYLSQRLTALSREQPYSMVLAVLSAMACTLFCFGAEELPCHDQDVVLRGILLPPPPAEKTSGTLKRAYLTVSDPTVTFAELQAQLKPALKNPLEKGEAAYLLYTKALQHNLSGEAGTCLRQSAIAGYQPAIQLFSQLQADALFAEIRPVFERQLTDIHSVRQCCIKCETILRSLAYLPKEYRGEASFILYFYISTGRYAPVTGETAEHYLEISHQCGYEAADEPWKNLHSAAITPKSAPAEVRTTGICHTNADNVYTTAFAKTIPDAWGGTSQLLDLKKLEQDISLPLFRRFLLFSDDFTKNLEDLFRLLQLVMDRMPDAKNLNWEIFIRHDSESVHALIDTALARISQYEIPVYIINDSKSAAQQLLSQHPLFYPVRMLSFGKNQVSDDRRPLLHFVILGDTAVAEWLVREAFWMMGVRGNALRTKITILAQHGADFETRLKGRFPGMARNNVHIDGIELTQIAGINVNPESRELAEHIRAVIEETPYCYFAVATDSDDRNLTLATRVRESLIRTAIASKEEDRLYQMPPVAFLCRNDQIAWLSKSMVIETEKHGHRWFNTRALIPFGQLSGRYSFENITGGTFALLARCIHFQYSQLTPQEALDHTEAALAAMRDYYLRQYNQDSSYSMALGMPYRLFQFQGDYSVHIFPTAWNILESAAFSSVRQLRNLAARLRENEAEYREIAEWEHARWVRWMLSRGWLPASFEDAVFACSCGNPRQQLFACKIHPCICAYEELKALQNILLEKCGLKKDFYTYDLNNIKATRQLLSLEWVLGETRKPDSRT